jgi:hypothetical protein
VRTPRQRDRAARSCIRCGARGWFYNVVDLVNRLETEAATDARVGSPII